MRTSNTARHALTLSASLMILGGCSGGVSQMSPMPLGQVPAVGTQAAQRQVLERGGLNGLLARRGGTLAGHLVTSPSYMDPSAVGKPLLFFVGYNVVDIYRQGGKNKKVGQVTGFSDAAGIATDTAGDLFVSDSDRIAIYAPPYTNAPKLVLDDSGNYAGGVAVSPRGLVAVINGCTAPSCPPNSSSVTFYAKNSTKPCATIADPTNFPSMYLDAFDTKENLYLTGSHIGRIVGGCRAKKINRLTTGNSLATPSIIRVDKSDRIAIFDYNTTTIYSYNAPKKGALGDPVSTTPLTTSTTYGVIVDFAFLASGADIYSAEQESSGNGVSNEYGYPAGGAPRNTIFLQQSVNFVAATPPLVP